MHHECGSTSKLIVAGVLLISGAAPAFAGELIGQLTDPEQPAVEASVDIINASIEQDGGLLTFVMETRGEIPVPLPSNETLVYIWFVDADNDPDTGQPHGALGSEFNVRAVIAGDQMVGFVDITGSLPGGGMGTVTVEANRIEMTIGLAQIANPEQFHWRCDAAYSVDGLVVSFNSETAVAVADTLPYTPPAHVEITSPLLMLCPTGPATGQLTVEVRDADGNPQPLDQYHLTFESTNPAVASVDDTGLVTAHAVPTQFNDMPYVNVWADGLHSDNGALIRVTSDDLGVEHQMYAAADLSLYLPAEIEGVDLDQITTEFQVVAAMSMAYAAQQTGIGTMPFNGGRHYFVLDVTDDPATVPCGASGNPVRLGWHFGNPIHNSCYIVNIPENRTPQWLVLFHEMGHNFTFASWGFGNFCGGPSGNHNVAYCEGFASLAALWSWQDIMSCPATLGQLAIDDIDQHYLNYVSVFRGAAEEYQSSGADYYNDLDPDTLDGILCEMYDVYGAAIWYGLFSAFLPANEPLPFTVDTIEKQSTWFVAALSASAGEDLRSLFTADYGFPIDDTAWPGMLSAAQERVSARVWVPPVMGDLDCDYDVDIDDFNALGDCLAGPDIVFPAGCNGADWDGAGDVDLADFAEFQAVFTGPGG